LEKLTNLLDWCKGERERLQRQLEMLKSGQFHIGENRGMGWVDISSQSIERVTVAVSELDRLLAEYETKASCSEGLKAKIAPETAS
jgi:hypothetical protein